MKKTKTSSKSTFFYCSLTDIQDTIAKNNPKNYSGRQSPFIFKFGHFFTHFNCNVFYNFIKEHMKNNERMQNFEWMENFWSKFEDYVKIFDKNISSLE